MNSFNSEPAALPATHQQLHLGWWNGPKSSLISDKADLNNLLRNLQKPVFAVLHEGNICFSDQGNLNFDLKNRPGQSLPLMGLLPSARLEYLGDNSFCTDHGLRYPYVGGSMAHGISSTNLAIELGKKGMLGFIGAAGDSPEKVEKAILVMKNQSEPVPFGFNLIHSPNERGLEDKIVDLYLKHEVRLIEASAFLAITLPLVRYRVSGIYENDNGEVVAPNKVIAKVSRVEIARKFFSPPPEKMLKKLVEIGDITAKQAELARNIPVAQDLTSEADSGGHTDNRPAVSLHPTMVALKNRIQKEFNYKSPLRVGFGGGIGTAASAAAAFTMGAAYIVTGTVNQACVESGTSDDARKMLAQAGQADMTMAPAGDMFEMGVTVQVLKRGTMFAMRARKLYEIYRKFNSIEEIPAKDRTLLEKTIFRDTLENIWQQTCEFFKQNGPEQIERAERDPHHKMALIFRWYLGKSPRWAVGGDPDRKVDYQIWCGPAMGAFNEWTKGSFLENAENRKACEVALNLLYGAAFEMRNSQLRTQGIVLNNELAAFTPIESSKFADYL
ncbi:MAG: PfaD family polyunsaturated fatty acid/polyketide biosynthesis protein [Candidatus Rifleibacteriota bacterium]